MELHALTAVELGAAIHRRDVSALEALRAVQERVDRLNPAINAIVTPNPAAEQRAIALDDLLARGVDLGPLHGVPMTIKDCFATAGLRTTSGYAPLAGHIPDRDATAVSRLVEAGVVIVGKTNLPALAGDFQTDNEVFGRTNNPWNPAWTAGGSSGGDAAAVAARLVPLGLGSDIGGSIRNPSHNCAVVGIKPTEHLVSTDGYLPGFGRFKSERHMNSVGPIARSIEDLQVALRIIAGPDNRMIQVAPIPLPPAAVRGVAGLRVTIAAEWPGMRTAAVIKEALSDLGRRLEAAGAVVDESFPGDLDVLGALETYGALFWTELEAALAPEEREAMLAELGASPDDPEPTGRGTYRALGASAALYLEVLDERDAAVRAWERFLAGRDVFIAPVSCVPAIDHCPIGTPIDIDGKPEPYWHAIGSYTSMFDLTGHPGVAIPLGFAPDGRPFGCQLVGPKWSDAGLLDIAGAISAAAGPRFSWPQMT